MDFFWAGNLDSLIPFKKNFSFFYFNGGYELALTLTLPSSFFSFLSSFLLPFFWG